MDNWRSLLFFLARRLGAWLLAVAAAYLLAAVTATQHVIANISRAQYSIVNPQIVERGLQSVGCVERTVLILAQRESTSFYVQRSQCHRATAQRDAVDK